MFKFSKNYLLFTYFDLIYFNIFTPNINNKQRNVRNDLQRA